MTKLLNLALYARCGNLLKQEIVAYAQAFLEKPALNTGVKALEKTADLNILPEDLKNVLIFHKIMTTYHQYLSLIKSMATTATLSPG